MLFRSYSSSAIVGRDQTVTIDAVGRYTLLDDRYREINDGPIPPWARDAVKQIYRFFAQ